MTQDEKILTNAVARRIDWTEIRRRMDRAQAALEQAARPTEDERRKILKARAKALARELKTDGKEQGLVEIIEFVVASEKYGVESSYVREVYPLKELTPLPGVPAFILGVINVRGQIVSVVDPKRFFGLPEKGLTDLNKVILMSDGRMEFGLLADAVLGLRHIPLNELQTSLPTLTGLRAELLKGVTSERLVVLDAARLLSDQSLVVRHKSET